MHLHIFISNGLGDNDNNAVKLIALHKLVGKHCLIFWNLKNYKYKNSNKTNFIISSLSAVSQTQV